MAWSEQEAKLLLKHLGIGMMALRQALVVEVLHSLHTNKSVPLTRGQQLMLILNSKRINEPSDE